MKTIKINVYHFSELSPETQQKIIQNRLNKDGYFLDFENETIQAIEKTFNLTAKGTYYGYDIAYFTFKGNKEYYREILDLTGKRAYSFIYNNFVETIKTEYNGNYYRKTFTLKDNRGKTRKSNVIFNDDFRGDEQDYIVMDTWKQFLTDFDGRSSVDHFLTLLTERVNKMIDCEIEYEQTTEYWAESFDINDVWFFENGDVFNGLVPDDKEAPDVKIDKTENVEITA